MKQLEKIARAVQANEEFVIATIVDTQGSTPGKIGFRIIIYNDRTEGTVGGGALENSIITEARAMLKLRIEARLMQINLAELKMECGGLAQVFMEPVYKKPPLWIFGAGHIARALAPLIAAIGFKVTVIDNREGFANQEKFPAGAILLTGDYDKMSREIPAEAFAVIITHGHEHDLQILLGLAAMNPPLPYIGMIGSKNKILTAKKALTDKGITNYDNIFAPIGLNLGGDTPEEIALSIAAEILGLYHQKIDVPHYRQEKGILITEKPA